ncbi:hypothetical protein CROQUDRAFT_101840 [Cronartium quercuum f. sp. fusiforme G11]|uniref:Uncharacterized protein n=1 Tax=Cronartium quercuum f. sp. fusiforme G11 TaxID=708437 RepID=A0A9P6T4Z6_9BASI|nr:hypothetical protein CROQUDRAFT_101840 [Cronartium quercuum f. sp. fusiforme G11]
MTHADNVVPSPSDSASKPPLVPVNGLSDSNQILLDKMALEGETLIVPVADNLTQDERSLWLLRAWYWKFINTCFGRPPKAPLHSCEALQNHFRPPCKRPHQFSTSPLPKLTHPQESRRSPSIVIMEPPIPSANTPSVPSVIQPSTSLSKYTSWIKPLDDDDDDLIVISCSLAQLDSKPSPQPSPIIDPTKAMPPSPPNNATSHHNLLSPPRFPAPNLTYTAKCNRLYWFLDRPDTPTLNQPSYSFVTDTSSYQLPLCMLNDIVALQDAVFPLITYEQNTAWANLLTNWTIYHRKDFAYRTVLHQAPHPNWYQGFDTTQPITRFLPFLSKLPGFRLLNPSGDTPPIGATSSSQSPTVSHNDHIAIQEAIISSLEDELAALCLQLDIEWDAFAIMHHTINTSSPPSHTCKEKGKGKEKDV